MSNSRPITREISTWDQYMRASRDANRIREGVVARVGPERPLAPEQLDWAYTELDRAREMREAAFQMTCSNTIEEEAAEQDCFGQPCRAELEAKIARLRGLPWTTGQVTPMREYSIEEAADAVAIDPLEVLRAVILGRIRSTKTGRRQALILESEIAAYMSIREVWPLVDKEMAEGWVPLSRPREWAHYTLPEPAWKWDRMPDGTWEAPRRNPEAP